MQKYIGVPFLLRGRTLEGADCWGLGWMIDRELGIDSPRYDASYKDKFDPTEVEHLIRGEIVRYWRLVGEDEARLGDRVLLSVGHHSHIGTVLQSPYFLHQWLGSNSEIQRWDAIMWRHRVRGFYRWAGP